MRSVSHYGVIEFLKSVNNSYLRQNIVPLDIGMSATSLVIITEIENLQVLALNITKESTADPYGKKF